MSDVIATGRCPTCRKLARKAGNKLFPFCSERCHLVDLGRWLAEDYRIPADDTEGQATGIDSLIPPDNDDER